MKFSNFYHLIKRANSTEKINELMQSYLLDFGIKHFAYTYYSYYPSSLYELKYEYATPEYGLWHKHYISQAYEDVDSTLKQVYRTSLPLLWDLTEQLKNCKTPNEKKMREDSIAFGIEKGVSIPLHGPSEDFAIFLLVQMKNENWYDQFADFQHEIFAAAYYYYSFLQKILLKSYIPFNAEQFNQREIQCLTLLAKQHSTNSIAEILNITERTVNYHIQRMNKKLGVQNKYQAVIKALNKGIIKL